MTPPAGTGNAAQTRKLIEQGADAALLRFAQQHPEIRRNMMEIPAPLKWAAALVGAVITTGLTAGSLWMVSAVSNMQVTLARMDERTAAQATAQTGETAELRRRVDALEGYHRQERNGR